MLTQKTPSDDQSLPILYRDESIIAIEKPHGLLVHRSPIDKHETRFAVQTLRDQIGQHVFPLHRLDRPTSGILLFALSSDVASKVGQDFMSRQVKKQYTAIVRGWLYGDGVIDYALKYKWDKYADASRRQQVPPQPAFTQYSPIRRFLIPMPVGRYEQARFTLVNLNPVSGRKHQLRRHMVHIRNPILGDTTHGDGKQNKFAQQAFDFKNLALSCTQMQFIHPETKHVVQINCPVSNSIQMLLEQWQRYQI